MNKKRIGISVLLVALIIAIMGINGMIDNNEDSISKIKGISLEDSKGKEVFLLDLNVPLDKVSVVADKHENGQVIWNGERRQTIDHLGNEIIKITFNDVYVSKDIMSNIKEARKKTNGVLKLNKKINYMITFPPDDAMMIVYIGTDQKNLKLDKIVDKIMKKGSKKRVSVELN